MLLALASEIPALEAESEGKLCGGFCELGFASASIPVSGNTDCRNNTNCDKNGVCYDNSGCRENSTCQGNTVTPTPTTPDKPSQTPTKCTGGCGLPAFGGSVLF